jgi:hypothetical protein
VALALGGAIVNMVATAIPKTVILDIFPTLPPSEMNLNGRRIGVTGQGKENIA